MAEQRPRMTDAELAAWLESVRRKHATRPGPPVQAPDRPCDRCRGRGQVSIRWIGWVGCSLCASSGSAVVARAKRTDRAREERS